MRKRTPLKNNPQKRSNWRLFFRGDPSPPGSWFGNHPAKKPPAGEGFLSIKASVDEDC